MSSSFSSPSSYCRDYKEQVFPRPEVSQTGLFIAIYCIVRTYWSCIEIGRWLILGRYTAGISSYTWGGTGIY
jgi:hypothetical protein